MKNRHPDSITKMRCESVQKSVLARLDNEPDEALWSQVENHLLSCTTCAEFTENSFALNARLRDELKDDFDPAPLWSRISLALDEETSVATRPSTQASGITAVTGGRMMAFGAVAAVMLAVVFTFSPIQNSKIQNTPLAVTESINDFLTFQASGRKLDVNSNIPLELRSWLVKRLDFEVPLNATVPVGFRLDGARLCSFLNRRLAAFMYHMGEKAASLYVMTETGLDATLKHVPKNNELTVFSSRGLTNVVWRSGGLLYVVVADFQETEAIKFAQSVGTATSAHPMKVTFLKGKPLEYANGISAEILEAIHPLASAKMSTQLLKS